jgi:hypothetical protein
MATAKRATASDSVIQSEIIPPARGSDGGLLLSAAAAWGSALVECQCEMVSFLLARLEKDRAVVHDALAARSWADAVMIHVRWVEDTVQDYSGQMTRMLTVASKHGAHGCLTWHPGAWATCPLDALEDPALDVWRERARK